MPTLLLRAAILLLVVQLSARAAFATRVEFIAKQGDQRLSGSEACFFPATVDDGFFQKFLSSFDVRCLSADVVIQMPLGNWNIFVNHGDTHTSTHPTMQLSDSQSEALRRAYWPQMVDMRPAAMLRVPQTTKDLRPVVYFPNLKNPDEPATVRPPIPGKPHVLVPAGTPVVPLLVRGLRILHVGEAVTLAPGIAADAVFAAPPKDHRDIVVLLRIAGSPDDGDEVLDTLDVKLESGKEVLKPVIAMRTGWAIDRSLLIFRNVPMQEATIVIGGRRWKAQRVDVPANTDPVHELPAIVLRRRGEIAVAWTRPAAAPVVPCRLKPTEGKPPHLAIAQCAADGTCREVEKAALEDDATQGNLTFTDLGDGAYRVTLRDERLGSALRDVQVAHGRTEDVTLALEPIRVSGSVKRGNRPLPADLSFLTGEATTDMHGGYAALLPRAPGLETVSVLPCDGSPAYIAIPAESLGDGSTFDIVVPRTEIQVRVSRQAGGTPLEGAYVHVAVLFGRDDVERYYLEAAPTNAEGETTLRLLPHEAWLRVCAGQTGYTERCSETFTLVEDEEKDFRLALSRDEKLEGRIVASAPNLWGWLFWIAPDGSVTERCHVATDGLFKYSRDHSPLETIAFVSRNHPLHLLIAPPNLATVPLELTLPIRPVRGFQIVPGTVRNAQIALEIDGRIVPQQVFNEHQMARGKQAAVHDGNSIPVADIAGADIVVLVGPPTNYAPPNTPPDIDLSSVPQFRAMFRRFHVRGATVQLSE